MKSTEKALVVLSGGQDSATCAAIAAASHTSVEAVFFDYGQRHICELYSARAVAYELNIKLHELQVTEFTQIADSALVTDAVIEQKDGQLPTSFVPGRNILFLTIAGALARKIGATEIYTGVCEADFSGYPDCREATIQALQAALQLGIDPSLKIKTPLMHLSKADSIHMINTLGQLDLLKYTHTCYEGEFPPCGKCPSCVLRAKGFSEASLEDPLMIRAKKESTRVQQELL